MKRAALVFVTLTLAPLCASALSAQETQLQALLAQLQVLQAQLLAMQSGSATDTCVAPAKILAYTDSGPDVTLLQRFLARDPLIYPEGLVTGYYGNLTRAAVRRFQTAQAIVKSSDSEYGAVRAKTLATIRRLAGCQDQRRPEAVIPPTGTGMATQTSAILVRPSIIFTKPATSTTATPGGTIPIAWTSVNAPASSSVALSLYYASGQLLGTVSSGLPSSGSYYWTLPVPPSNTDTCAGDPLTCIVQIAQPGGACTGLCSVGNGTYRFLATLLSSGAAIARTASPMFFVSGSSVSSNVSTNASSSDSYSSQFFADLLKNGANTTPFVEPKMCIYSGISYADGITLEVNCADVKLPLTSCGNYGGLALTCRNGAWVDKNGVAQSIPNVTNVGGGCTTPWGNQQVANGNEVPYEPFFTNGTYSGGTQLPIMKCSGGGWKKCDWQGANC
ncbi:peptidoglycan-binding protein [Candidatus Kaiserbacteria bacterium]|nr:peptidoglycan-binding protein [Candidatus Kaiserbacteria bacterium]